MSIEINNIKPYAYNCKYVVVRTSEGELWFYGADNSLSWATEAAKEVNGLILVKGINY